ncbi:MAG: 4-alpha-glucanotransferase [Chloroflexi bacterium]|nr:4-alpha-glucanotransferase [Chloroflexota bacterium]
MTSQPDTSGQATPHVQPDTAPDTTPDDLPEVPRRAGILLHPTSLPGAHGVGDLGAAAYRFVEYLEAGRQTLWQVMPLGPVGLGNSPYAARSAFAGNPLLIALDQLWGRGWLDEGDLRGPDFPPDQVQFEEAAAFKERRLRMAFRRFERRAPAKDRAKLETFCGRHRAWLDDFALFMSIKEANGGRGWMDWERGLALRDPDAVDDARGALADDVRFHQFVQWIFFEQWGQLRRYANERGILIVGDIPIFVALDSSDVWVHRDLFLMDAQGRPTAVAGVPPDAFSETGQRWGNPLYDWGRLARNGYRWWLDRFRATLELVDTVRLDHFRGFQAYWEVPAEEETAIHGRWVPGPGAALFDALEAELGRIPMIVEDLGEITPDVIALRERLGFPGLKVLQFAFGDDAQVTIPQGKNPYLPHNYEPNCVTYTGTHDNDTTAGWYASLDDATRSAVLRYLGWGPGAPVHHVTRELVRMAYRSVARWAIVPLQDVLGLGSEARMNVPGLPEHNWTWRYPEHALQPDQSDWLADLTATYGRWQPSAEDELPESTTV